MIAGNSKTPLNELMESAYPDLRTLAGRFLSKEPPGQVLQPTALAHEVYLRLLKQKGCAWSGRTHCLAVAALMMRRILVDQARSQSRRNRNPLTVQFATPPQTGPSPTTDLLALHDALQRLAAVHARKARVVELRFFGGLSLEETAGAIGITTRTVERDWQFARAWLFRELFGEGQAS